MNRAAGFASSNHDVNVEILHGRVKNLLHCHGHAVDFIDKKDIARLQIIEKGHQVPCFFNNRAAGLLDIDPQLIGNNKGHGGLPQTRGAKKQGVVQGFIPQLGCLDEDFQLVLDLVLADVFI